MEVDPGARGPRQVDAAAAPLVPSVVSPAAGNQIQEPPLSLLPTEYDSLGRNPEEQQGQGREARGPRACF